MAKPGGDASSIGGAHHDALVPWRKLVAALAATLVIVGALWVVLFLLGPPGPLVGNLLTPILVLVFIVWVGVDAVVRELSKRARPRDRE